MDSDVLNAREWDEYRYLVDAFARAKLAKDYAKSDQLRAELSLWQAHTSDDQFIAMHKTGTYQWFPLFEQQGADSRRHHRITKREAIKTMSTFQKGDKVRQIVPVIEGFVAGFQIDQNTGDRLILVDYVDADGNDSSRYFKETELEPGEAAEAAAETPEPAVQAAETSEPAADTAASETTAAEPAAEPAAETTAEAAQPSAEEGAASAE